MSKQLPLESARRRLCQADCSPSHTEACCLGHLQVVETAIADGIKPVPEAVITGPLKHPNIAANLQHACRQRPVSLAHVVSAVAQNPSSAAFVDCLAFRVSSAWQWCPVVGAAAVAFCGGRAAEDVS